MANKNKYYVYGYIRLDNNTYFYIGKGTGRRVKELSISRSDHFKNIVEKVNVCYEILYDNLTEEEAYELERDTIEDLVFNEGYSISIKGFTRNENHLVNKSWGGDGNQGFSQSEEAKEKLREYHTGKKLSESTKYKLSILNTGESHPNYGKHLSESTKEKISKANKGRERTEEWLEKLSESHKGIPSPNRKKVLCIELDIEFESVAAAKKYMQEQYGFKSLHIAAVCRGDRPHSGILPDGTKLHWRYIEDTPATTEHGDKD